MPIGVFAAASLGGCGSESPPGAGCPDGKVLADDGSCAPAGASGQGGQGGASAGQGGAPAGQAGQGGAGAAGEGGGGGTSVPLKATVRGTLAGREGLRPGAPLWVGGRPVVTDSDGKFEVPDVEVPYQLVLKGWLNGELEGRPSYSFYDGLRSTELSLYLDDSDPNVRYNEAHVTGKLAGAGAHPQPAGYRSYLVAVDDQGHQIGYGDITNFGSNASSAFDVTLRWPQAKGGTVGAKLYAIQYKETSDHYVDRYTGYGFEQLTATAGATASSQTINLTAVATTGVKINVTVPAPTYNVSSARSSFRLAEGGVALDNVRSGAAVANPPFFLKLPLSAVDARLSVTLRDANYAEVTQSVPLADTNASELTFQPPLPVELQEPAAGASIAVGQKFSWAKLENAVYRVTLRADDYSGAWFSFYTPEPSFSLPDLSAFGAEFTRGKPYAWGVTSFAPIASTDEYLANAAAVTTTATTAPRAVALQ